VVKPFETWYPVEMNARQRATAQLVGALILIARGETPNLIELDPGPGPLPDMGDFRDGQIVKQNKHLYMNVNGCLFKQTIDRALDAEWEEVIIEKEEDDDEPSS
jgi:hypothetical protein